jgi:hypothetical protein
LPESTHPGAFRSSVYGKQFLSDLEDFMKTKSNVKVGGLSLNRCETFRR